METNHQTNSIPSRKGWRTGASAIGVGFLLIAGACTGGYDSGDTVSSAAPTTAPTALAAQVDAASTSPGTASEIASLQTDAGWVLGANGLALYVFDNDQDGVSNCSGECLVNWPPLLADDVDLNGADANLFSTITRDDGFEQVTVDGRPLYFFAADSTPTDINGQGVGGVWWLVDATGKAIPGSDMSESSGDMSAADGMSESSGDMSAADGMSEGY